MKCDFYYGTVFVLFAIVAAAQAMRGGMGCVLAWPALSFLLVGVAYFTGSVAMFGKRPNGTRAPLTAVALGPYLWLTQFVWLLQIRLTSAAAISKVNEQLILARRLRDFEVPSGVIQICDLTCEFAEPRGIRQHAGFICHPILDAGVSPATALVALVRRLSPNQAGPVLIHCANGYGRTGMVAAIWLLAHGFASTTDEALDILRSARPGIRLRSRQLAIVRTASTLLQHPQAMPSANSSAEVL